MKNKKPASGEILLYADSESNPDMFYFGGVFVPDAFIAFSHQGRRIAVVSQLEFGRVVREGRFDDVLPLEQVEAEAMQKAAGRFVRPVTSILFLARKFGIKSFRIASDFPCGVAFGLKEAGFKLEVASGLLLPEREFKNDQEAGCIREGNAAASAGFRVFEKMLRASVIKRGFLYLGKRRLTSEMAREAIAVECLKRGAISGNAVVAGGDQACDPHCRGTGPLRAGELIVVDIFPRVSKTGFHGDMTRTYLKGRAGEVQKELVATVFEAQQAALREHRSGKSARKIYQSVVGYFEDKGYPSTRKSGVPVGFIHGLGHGLGLAVHEPPRVNPSGARLRKGQVITVEPGLYYPGLGGVRIEDVVRVTSGEPEMLSSHPYRWNFR